MKRSLFLIMLSGLCTIQVTDVQAMQGAVIPGATNLLSHTVGLVGACVGGILTFKKFKSDYRKFISETNRINQLGGYTEELKVRQQEHLHRAAVENFVPTNQISEAEMTELAPIINPINLGQGRAEVTELFPPRNANLQEAHMLGNVRRILKGYIRPLGDFTSSRWWMGSQVFTSLGGCGIFAGLACYCGWSVFKNLKKCFRAWRAK